MFVITIGLISLKIRYLLPKTGEKTLFSVKPGKELFPALKSFYNAPLYPENIKKEF